MVQLNNAADTIEDLNDMPVKTVNGATIFMRDVGHVRDGNPPQHNIVHVDGGRAVLSTVLKNGAASTLDVVQGIKDMLPHAASSSCPTRCKIDVLNDQSIFVKAAITGVVREGAIAAGADQPDDPAVPGKLALHRHHRHLDPAGGAVRR